MKWDFGIIPESELARKFIDIAGVVNQRIMDLCDKSLLSWLLEEVSE